MNKSVTLEKAREQIKRKYMTIKQRDFEKYLMDKYPDLFPKDIEGNTIAPECGVSCPTGWEDLVDNLCGSISSYTKHNTNHIKQYQPLYKAHLWVYNKVTSKVLSFLTGLVDPLKPYLGKGGFVTGKFADEIKAKNPRKDKLTKWLWSVSYKLRPLYGYKSEPIRPVTIEQIKSKYGTLRFYASGGNDKTDGMIWLAESMSAKI